MSRSRGVLPIAEVPSSQTLDGWVRASGSYSAGSKFMMEGAIDSASLALPHSWTGEILYRISTEPDASASPGAATLVTVDMKDVRAPFFAVQT